MKVPSKTPRILIVDDNPDIHLDFKKVLCPSPSSSAAIDELEASLFGTTPAQPEARYHVDSAFQGDEALKMIRRALRDGCAYALAFIDMRMPPGWDGMQTMTEIKRVDPTIEFVVCSAYSDYTPDEVCARLEIRDGILFMAKPFVPQDVRAIAARMALVASAC